MKPAIVALLPLILTSDLAVAAPPINQLQVPKGFSVSIYAGDISGARSMTMAEDGTLFVGTRGSKVYWIRNGKSQVLLNGLKSPNGVAYRDGDLYVAEISRVLKYPKILSSLANPPAPVIVRDDFPKETHHGWKFIAFGPDGKLYVPVGAPCNVCLEKDERFASITRMDPDGKRFEIVARGVRNTVGFAWHPKNQELWFTDNGRDWMGDDTPNDELNRVAKPGQHFGFPFCHEGSVADPEFGKQRGCGDFVPPARKLGAHVAALGMRFYTGTHFPAEYRERIFIAEHGSWNRSTRSGYRVGMATIGKDGQVTQYEAFLTGFVERDRFSGKETVHGRPVDVLVDRDGTLLVSDDHAGVIYRVSYGVKN